jgi:tRNA G26 N,N-dimethylase Trm1
MRKIVQLDIVTAMERHEAIDRVRMAIRSSGGWVIDEIFFSNKALTTRFEIDAHKMTSLLEALQERGLRATPVNPLPVKTDSELSGTISMTFSHNEPDLKQIIPAVG